MPSARPVDRRQSPSRYHAPVYLRQTAQPDAAVPRNGRPSARYTAEWPASAARYKVFSDENASGMSNTARFHEQRDTKSAWYHDHVSRGSGSWVWPMRSAAPKTSSLRDGAKTDNGGQKTERTAYSVFYRRDHLQRPHAIIAPTKKLASSNAEGKGWNLSFTMVNTINTMLISSVLTTI